MGFLVDSTREVFDLLPEKRNTFLDLVEELKVKKVVSVKSGAGCAVIHEGNATGHGEKSL